MSDVECLELYVQLCSMMPVEEAFNIAFSDLESIDAH